MHSTGVVAFDQERAFKLVIPKLQDCKLIDLRVKEKMLWERLSTHNPLTWSTMKPDGIIIRAPGGGLLSGRPVLIIILFIIKTWVHFKWPLIWNPTEGLKHWERDVMSMVVEQASCMSDILSAQLQEKSHLL